MICVLILAGIELNFFIVAGMGLWWVDLGWMPGAHHATLSLPLLNRTGTENMTKGLWIGAQEDRERSLSNYVTGKTDLTWGNWFNLLPIKSEQDNEK